MQLDVGPADGGSLDRVVAVTSKGRRADWRGRTDEGGASPRSYMTAAHDPIVGFERGGGGACPGVTRVLRLSDARAK